MTQYESVIEFMHMMGQPVLETPTCPTSKLGILRCNLIAEEVEELSEAFENDDYVEIADALADILYVTFGAYASFGLPVQAAYKYQDKAVECGNEATLLTMGEAVRINKAFNTQLQNLMHSLGTDSLRHVEVALDEIIAITYQTAWLSGIDIFSCFKEVHDSNMSKACLTQSDAESSIVMRKHNPDTREKYMGAVVRQIGERFIICRGSDGKVLKGKHYFEPDLSKYLRLK